MMTAVVVAVTAVVAGVAVAAAAVVVAPAGADLSTDLINGSNSNEPSFLSAASDSLRSTDSSLLPVFLRV